MRVMTTETPVESVDDFDAPASRGFVRYEIGKLRTEMIKMEASLRAEIHRLEVGLRQDMASMHRSLLRWFVATQIATIGVVAALINSLGG